MEDRKENSFGKVDFSRFKYEKQEPLWKDVFGYIPYMAEKTNAIIRLLLLHPGVDFNRALSIIYGHSEIFRLLSDWRNVGWDISHQEYYRRYRIAEGLAPLKESPVVLSPYDDEQEMFLVALENARNRLGYEDSNVFWERYKDKIDRVWTSMGTKGFSSEEMESYLEIAIPSYEVLSNWMAEHGRHAY